jgi:hypothetical protein
MNSKSKIDKITDDLDEYLRSKGIPSESIDVFLSMSRQELAGLPAEELFGIAYEIQAHSYVVQSLLNQKQAIVEVCKKKIQNYVGTKLHEYSIFGNAEKLRYAIEDNDAASELDQMMEGPSLVVTRLNNLAFQLSNLSKTVNELAKSKRNEKNYN